MVQQTHLNAFVQAEQEAAQRVVAANAELADARRALNERRVEEGLKPLDFEEEERKKQERKAAAEEEASEDAVPEEASGFGAHTKKDRAK